MQHQSLSTYISLLAGSAIALSTASAQAASFTAQDAVNAGCVGQTNCTVSGFTLDVTKAGVDNPEITAKTEGGIQGLGIARDASNLSFTDPNGDPSGGEIDLDEAFRVTFPAATILEQLQLSTLYQPGVFGDEVFEAAQITALDALGNLTATVATLTVQGDALAISTGGTVANISPSVEGSGGSYLISDLFGNLEIGGFVLEAFSQTAGDGSTPSSFRNSDFTLTAVKTADVPEPGSVAALLGMGLLGLLARRRSR